MFPQVNGMTPLHYATKNKHKRATEFLLFCGADLTMTDKVSITSNYQFFLCRFTGIKVYTFLLILIWVNSFKPSLLFSILSFIT